MRIRHVMMGLFAFAALSFLSGSALAACTGKASFEDDFQTLDPSWGTADATLLVQNGSLLIKPQPGYIRWALSQSDYYGDGSICVMAAITEASAVDQVQPLVLFWATSDYANMYALNLGTDGKQGFYKVDKLSNKRWLTPIPWTADPGIKFALGDFNAVEVQMAGHTASIIINGKKLNQLNGDPPDGGGLIGLGASSGNGVNATFSFQKFQFFKAASP
ncbi:MAG: hypothetical protein ABSC72_08350 [Methylovirgula sp.]|jgi:hypothetical protein